MSINKLPNLKHVTESEFWGEVLEYGIRKPTGYIQVFAEQYNDVFDELCVEHCGVAEFTLFEDIGNGKNYAILKSYDGFKRMFPEFFTFGCDHKEETHELVGRCLHKHTCNACGRVRTVDSGD